MLAQIGNIYHDLKEDIKKVNDQILESLNVEEQLVYEVGSYLANSGGKRIRPIFTILVARMFGYNQKEVIFLASAIESVHMATLLHDDVIDDSTMRRSKPSANIIWGKNTSILIGDFLFSQAFDLMVSAKSLESLQVLSKAVLKLAEGEVAQLAKLNSKVFIDEESYFKIIRAKTAELFAASCKIGSIISGQTKETSEKLHEFGIIIGIIFQLKDDALDYFANDNIDKNKGDDFFEKKITLPLILLEKELSQNNDDYLKILLTKDQLSKEDFENTQKLMQQYHIQEKLSNYINSLEEKAKNIINSIDNILDQKSKSHIIELLEFLSNRQY